MAPACSNAAGYERTPRPRSAASRRPPHLDPRLAGLTPRQKFTRGSVTPNAASTSVAKSAVRGRYDLPQPRGRGAARAAAQAAASAAQRVEQAGPATCAPCMIEFHIRKDNLLCETLAIREKRTFVRPDRRQTASTPRIKSAIMMTSPRTITGNG